MLTGLLSISAQRIVFIDYKWMEQYPRLVFLLSTLALASPIIIVAYIHHLIQLVLDRLDPDGASDTKLKGIGAFFPMVMSWWEGLYAWLVLLLSTILSAGILGTIIPWQDPNQILDTLVQLYDMLMDMNKLKYLFSQVTIIWILVAAYLYQFEHVVMFRGRQS